MKTPSPKKPEANSKKKAKTTHVEPVPHEKTTTKRITSKDAKKTSKPTPSDVVEGDIRSPGKSGE